LRRRRTSLQERPPIQSLVASVTGTARKASIHRRQEWRANWRVSRARALARARRNRFQIGKYGNFSV